MLLCRTINRLLGSVPTFVTGGGAGSGGTVTLNALTLATPTISEAAVSGTVVSTISGKTTGSTLSLTDDAGGRFALNGSNQIITGLVGFDYEAATGHNIILRETLAGATNTPRDTMIAITVTDVDDTAPVLTSPAGAATGGTTANISVVSDEANGTLYWAILPAASAAPSAAAFLAGTTGGVATGSTASPNASSNGFSPTGLTSETAYKAHFFQRDAAGNNSNVASSASFTTADVTAPTLSSPTDAANGTTGGTLSVSTNEGNGTLYWYVSTSATPPSAADLKAGTGAVAAGSQAVSATGVQNASATGLTASTAYYAHFLHRDAANNDSSIVSGDGFTTDAASSFAVTGTLGDGQWDVAYSDSLTISGGTPPYAISGLPYGLSSDLPASPATISGTPL